MDKETITRARIDQKITKRYWKLKDWVHCCCFKLYSESSDFLIVDVSPRIKSSGPTVPGKVSKKKNKSL